MSKPRVLYIVYWGAGEPLGLSLVVPAVIRLAGLGVDLTLVTFEKASDGSNRAYMDQIRGEFNSAGVKWVPLRYHKTPKLPATLFDILQAVTRSIRLRMRARFDIVHARTFIGGLMGMLIAPMIGAKLIYHNEGFYPDEQVDAGVWVEGSPPHRVAKWLETRTYESAHGVIALSHRARELIERLLSGKQPATPVIVVPSCVDSRFFTPLGDRRVLENGNLRLVHSGSVGGRYLLDRIGRFVAIAARDWPKLHLSVLTRAEPKLVSDLLHAGGLEDKFWSTEQVSFSEMPGKLAESGVGLLFWPRGLSEHGTSPTKVGEYWATGLPVVVTPNVSDLDEIIVRERVGVVIRGHTDADYEEALTRLMLLLQDPELPLRCRRAAEVHYSLDVACDNQHDLYRRLLYDRQAEPAQQQVVERTKE